MPVETVPSPRSAPVVESLVRHTRELLELHVPLTLLMDLAEPSGPRSEARLLAER